MSWCHWELSLWKIGEAGLRPGTLSASNGKMSLIIGGELRNFRKIVPVEGSQLKFEFTTQSVSVLFLMVAKPETWPR